MSTIVNNVAGTGTATSAGVFHVTGALEGFVTLASGLSNAVTYDYKVVPTAGGSAYQTGKGTWATSGSVLTSTSVTTSSNSGLNVDFGADALTVYISADAATLNALSSTTAVESHIADTSDAHALDSITGLTSALAGKAASSHTQAASTITDFDTAVAANSAVTANSAKLTANTANVTAAGALMDSEVTSLVNIKSAVIPATLVIDTAAKPFLAATTAAEQYAALDVSKLYLAGLANGGKIRLCWMGQSQSGPVYNTPIGESFTAYTPNSAVRVYQGSSSSFITADPSVTSAYSSGSWVGQTGTITVDFGGGPAAYVTINAAIEMGDYIQKATGMAVDVFLQFQSATSIVQWLSGGTSYSSVNTHMAAALTASGGTFYDIMVWDQGDADRSRNYEDYVADGLTLRTYLETQGLNRHYTQWVIMEYNTNVYSTYWAGQEAFYDALGQNAHFISAKDFKASETVDGLHYNGNQQRTRVRQAAQAVLGGPSSRALSIKEARNLSWLRGSVSTVANGASAKAFNLATSTDYSTSGAKLLSISNLTTEKLSLDKDGGLTLSATLTQATGYIGTTANGAGAIAHKFVSPAYSNATSKIASFYNNTTAKLTVDWDGVIQGEGGPGGSIYFRPDTVNPTHLFQMQNFFGAGMGVFNWAGTLGMVLKSAKADAAGNAFQLDATTTMSTGNLLVVSNNNSASLRATINYQGAPGFWGVTPVTTQPTAGSGSNFTANSGTAMNSASTSTGGTGSTAVTFADVVFALKKAGLIAV